MRQNGVPTSRKLVEWPLLGGTSLQGAAGQLVQLVANTKIDLLVAAPLARPGMRGGGTLDEVGDFAVLVADVQRRSERPLPVLLVHHKHRATTDRTHGLRPAAHIDSPPRRSSHQKSTGRRMMAKEIRCCIGVHFDAVAGWLGSYGGEDSPDDISRGMFAGEVGSHRLLKLFADYSLKTTWFIPGHSIETFPDTTQLIVEAGHEIGLHGYSHENPLSMTPQQEEAVLVKCIALVEQASQRRPTGYVAPWWEFSNVTNELLLHHGIKYDHSLMHDDFHPYYVRTGDVWTKIDYSKPAEYWMHPLIRGTETDLIEIPASWYLDDLPPMLFIKSAPNSHGFVNPRHLEEIWRDQFDYVYREEDYAVFPIAIHPDVSGRPQVILMLERIIEHITGHDGVRWMTFDEAADDFARRSPRPTGG
jgi:peptidoglycan/xylan/chitin deacetylase (PgdA/CDA1 family)